MSYLVKIIPTHPKDSHWRGGICFNKQGVILSEKQIEAAKNAIEADPALIVEKLATPKSEAKSKAKK